MPTATSTFSLNISAIQALCKGNQILSSSIAPLNSTGTVGDFYINYTSWVLYGPKDSTTYWSTSTNLIGPSGTNGVNGSLSATNISLSSCYIGNTTRAGLIVSATSYPCIQLDTTGYTVGTFSSNNNILLTIGSDAITMSANSVNIDGPLTITGGSDIYTDVLTVGTLFETSSSQIVIGGIGYVATPTYGGEPAFSPYNVGIIGGRTIIAATQLDIFNGTAPASLVAYNNSVNKTRVGINISPSDITSVSALCATFTVNGSISALSSFASNRYDSNSNRILTTRQTPGFATLTTTNSSTDILIQVNSIMWALTAHGLAI